MGLTLQNAKNSFSHLDAFLQDVGGLDDERKIFAKEMKAKFGDTFTEDNILSIAHELSGAYATGIQKDIEKIEETMKSKKKKENAKNVLDHLVSEYS